MINLVRLALRVTDEEFDPEIEMLSRGCLAELADIGIISKDDISSASCDPEIQTCIVAYCRWKFGENKDAEKWEGIYKDMVGRLKQTTGYGLR